MTPPAVQRRVRHLSLRAATSEAATRAAVTIEDALRTASWPAADSGRLVLIRRLNLGRIPHGASSASVALHLERRCRDVSVELIADAAVDRRMAGAVVFAGRAEALALLAERVARGQSADEWFWPLAVPGWQPTLSGGAAWRVLVDAAMTQLAAPLVTAEVVSAAANAGRLPELAFGLSGAVVARFCAACHWDAPPEPGEVRTTSPVPIAIQNAVYHELLPVNAPPAVKAWLAALLVVRRRPTLAAVRELPRIAQQFLTRAPSVLTPSALATPGSVVPKALSAVPIGDPRTLPGDHEPDIAISLSGLRQSPEASAIQDVSSVAARSDEPSRLAAPTTTPEESTACGGLLFLVPALARLGFPGWLDQNPDLLGTNFATDLLLSLGQRVGLRDDDPLVRALNVGPTLGAQASLLAKDFSDRTLEHRRDASAPSHRPLIDGSGGSGEGDGKPDEGLFTHWRLAVRRWCRVEARIGLATLICRPARVRAGRTHLDLAFDLSQTDLRIRRAGLDLDPGWVPWLGRVIRFHYLTPDEYDD
ncbi:MAG TPA: hypothetical protein PLX89_09060 [Verrucomicrobiota bacterium]|nr:hypothetical protein [Verrucomicrobiota bacterium]